MRNGNFLRKEKKDVQTQQKMQHKQCDDMSRVNAQIKKQGRDYLPESFDLNLYQQPVWKPISKDKWRT